MTRLNIKQRMKLSVLGSLASSVKPLWPSPTGKSALIACFFQDGAESRTKENTGGNSPLEKLSPLGKLGQWLS